MRSAPNKVGTRLRVRGKRILLSSIFTLAATLCLLLHAEGNQACGEQSRNEGERQVLKFEPEGPNPIADAARAAFLKRYFDIASSEYQAAAPVIMATLEKIASLKKGPIRMLDVGCGQGHLMSLVLERLPKDIAERIVIDYLDPQVENLRKYAEKIPHPRLGRPFTARWENFYPDHANHKYDFILVFQSLWSYPLATEGPKFSGFSRLLTDNGATVIGHSLSHTAYFTLLRELGVQFHTTLPQLNTGEQVLATLNEQNLRIHTQTVPVIQSIPAKDHENLFVYLAAGLYLASAEPVRQTWAQLEPQLAKYRNAEDRYEFNQDILFVHLTPPIP
jgi:SAM-dependent methyltransferase